MEKLALHLTPIEMTYLARLLGAEMLVGIGDPFFGWLAEEIKEAWEEAGVSLVAKGALGVREDGAVIVDVLAGGIIAVCARPQATIILFNKPYKEEGSTTVFHLTQGLCVEHPYPQSADEEVELILYDNPAPAVARIWEEADLSEAKSKGKAQIKTTMDKLWVLLQEAQEDSGDIGGAITKAGIRGNAAGVLADTLSPHFAFSSLLRLDIDEGEWRAEGVAFLKGEGHQWRISPDMQSESINITMKVSDFDRAKKDVEKMIGISS